MSRRHDRQERLPQVGRVGQARLADASVAIVGLGATGSHLADVLLRAGVGRLRLVDRDVVELDNLPRQTLYTTADAERLRPKAEAAAAALAAVDPGVHIEPVVVDLDASSLASALGDARLVLDGTDNFATRMLLNDHCVRAGLPFVYSGVVGTEGQVLVVRPGSACLRCYVPDVPPPGSLPTCDTAGVLGATVSFVAAIAATCALKLLLEDAPADTDTDTDGEVLVLDGWAPSLRRIALPRDPDCPCCGRGEYPFLERPTLSAPTRLCGRDAVQLPSDGARVDLELAAERLRSLGPVERSAFLVRVDLPEHRLLLFADGRVIVAGTSDPALARSLRARVLGG